jgi:hypothetical protein
MMRFFKEVAVFDSAEAISFAIVVSVELRIWLALVFTLDSRPWMVVCASVHEGIERDNL